MRCLMRRLMLVCAILSLSSCVHAPPPTDSFCQIYNRVVVAKGDGAITATAGVKRRLLANELTYRDQCIPKK
jgi:hypothetical protein